jgi:hypothetical protein
VLLLEFSSGLGWMMRHFFLAPLNVPIVCTILPFLNFWRIVWLIAGNWENGPELLTQQFLRGAEFLVFRLIWTGTRWLFVQRHRGRLIDTMGFVSCSSSSQRGPCNKKEVKEKKRNDGDEPRKRHGLVIPSGGSPRDSSPACCFNFPWFFLLFLIFHFLGCWAVDSKT